MKEIQLEEMWGKINKALTSENKTFLESKTAKILPNNPTSQGFSADQIRKSLYEGILVLFEWLKTTNNSNVDFNNKVMETLTAITENNEEDKQDLANLKQSLIDGTFNVKYLTWAIMATNDENGNRIIDTYATIERLTQVLEALTQEISDRKAADDLEKKERKEETSAIINSVNQEISDRTNAVSVLNNLLTAETENRTSEDEKVLQYAQSVNEALGNAKTDLQGKIDSEAQTRLTSDNEIKASITSKEDSLKALINSVKNELNGYITTLSNRVNNLPTNYVFDTYESMTSDLLNASNTKYKVGDTLFIKEVNKPDYWVSAILSTKGTYGYYELSEQESKVDLSNYVKISELSREAIEEKFLEEVENGQKSFAAKSFTSTGRNSGIDVNNYVEYGCDGVSFRKNGVKYPIDFPQKQGIFALTSDIPQALKNPFSLTINGKVYDGSSAVSITTETITEHDFVRFWHAGIEIQNDGTNNILRFSAFDTELEEFSPHISCQYDGPQYYWLWKFPQISGTFAMESQIPTKLSQLTNDGNYQTNTSDLKDNTTTFTTASERSNIASGEKLSVSFGKIAKYFSDLKAVAFSGSKADIGLGNVDNTADKDKPISTATKTALDKKANTSDLTSHTSNTNNPHNVTKSQVGLGNVDNTSDANKPVSNATQQALNNKANSSDVYTKTDTDGLLNNKANTNDVYSKTKTDELLNNKANKSDVYTKTETDAGLNKSLYNLGYYDTMVENSDGTYTITRQTGYIVLDGVENKFYGKSSSTNNGLYYTGAVSNYIEIPSSESVVGNVICNRFETYYFYKLYNNNIYGIAIVNNGNISIGLTTAITTTDEANAYLLQNPISIQYKLKKATTEKVEANHYAQYNQTFILEHNKTEAERSVNLLDVPDKVVTSDGVTFTISNGVINVNGSTSSYPEYPINSVELQAGTYTISKSVDNRYLYIWVGSSLGNNDIVNRQDISATFTIKTNMRVYITIVSTSSQTYSNFKFSLMLNKGTTALPYQPYNQNKHITNNEAEFLKSEAERSANLLENTNVHIYNLDFLEYKKTYTVSFNFSDTNGVTLFDGTSKIVDSNLSSGYHSFTFTKNSVEGAYLWFNETNKVSNIMLNEGTEPLPYQPYEGKVVHEKDLESITPGIFSLVGNNVDTLTISKNETYFITSVAVNPIYVEGNTGISFIGSSLVTTVGMLSGEPKICLNGSAYTLDNNSVTLKTTGLMKVYKVNY